MRQKREMVRGGWASAVQGGGAVGSRSSGDFTVPRPFRILLFDHRFAALGALPPGECWWA
jgi:hypothetical protein